MQRTEGSKFLKRLLGYAEFRGVVAMGKVFGLPAVVRYLRNPNPLSSVRVLQAFGATVGEGTTIKGSLYLDNAFGDRDATGDFTHLKIGSNCYIGDSVFFDLANSIVIEDHAVIAGRASFVTHSECGRSPMLSQVYPRRCEQVVIGSGAWIGFGATILCGVRIGTNATIGANSLVLRDVAAHYLYAGSPAGKVIQREIPTVL